MANTTGQLEIVDNYEKGKRHGSYYCYRESGQLWHEYTFYHGQKLGIFRQWNDKGELNYEIDVDDSNRHEIPDNCIAEWNWD